MQYDLQKNSDEKPVLNEKVSIEKGEALKSAIFIQDFNDLTKINPPYTDIEFFDMKLIALGFGSPSDPLISRIELRCPSNFSNILFSKYLRL